MRKTLGFLSVAALAAAPMIFGTGSPAGARTATPRLTVVTYTAATASPDTLTPFAKLKAFGTNGRRAKYVPNTLTIPPGDSPKCRPSQNGASIKNRTLFNQTITYHGKPMLTLGPQIVALFCSSGPAQFILGVSSSTSTITLNFS
jgi:hypothetical protein